MCFFFFAFDISLLFDARTHFGETELYRRNGSNTEGRRNKKKKKKIAVNVRPFFRKSTRNFNSEIYEKTRF